MPGPAWLVLPTFNEAENLETVVAAARARAARDAAPEGFRMLVVDDGSPDGTGAHRRPRWPRRTPARSRCCTAPSARASGPAYLAASRARSTAGAGYVFEMDADFSHDPADLARLLARRARRRRRPRARLALRRPAAASPTGASCGASSAAAGRGTRGASSACRCATSPAASSASAPRCCEAIDLPTVRSRGYAFQVELTYRALVRGLRVVEVPIVFRDRELGHVEDVVADRRRGGVARAAAAPGRRAPPTSGRGRLKRAPSSRRIDTG